MRACGVRDHPSSYRAPLRLLPRLWMPSFPSFFPQAVLSLARRWDGADDVVSTNSGRINQQKRRTCVLGCILTEPDLVYALVSGQAGKSGTKVAHHAGKQQQSRAR